MTNEETKKLLDEQKKKLKMKDYQYGQLANKYNKLKQILSDLQGELIERIKKLSVEMDNEPAIIGRDLAILEIKSIFSEKLKDVGEGK